MSEGTVSEQPAKKRKVNFSCSTEMECDVDDTAKLSQQLQGSEGNPVDLTNTPMDQCDIDQTEAMRDPTEITEDLNGSAEELTESPSVSQDKLHNTVAPEELEQLKRFHVLDEVKSNDEDSNDENSDDSDGKSVELPDEEIQRMLEADLPDSIKGAPKAKEKPFITRQKIVLEEKGINHFEVLPLDWIMVRHMSGMPVYMHRFSRVCTLSKPYFLGRNNTRRHEIPISAIPCFAYRRALEEEEKQKEIDKKVEEQIRNGTWTINNANNQNTNSNTTLFNGNIPNGSGNPGAARAPQSSSDEKTLEPEPKKGLESTDPQDDYVDLTNQQMPNANGNQKPESGQQTPKTDKNIRESKDTKSDLSAALTSDMLLEEASLIKEDILQSTSGTCPFSKGKMSMEDKPHEKDGEKNIPPSTIGDIPMSRRPVVLPGGIVMPSPRVESIDTSWKTQHLSAEQINDYCKKLFKFRTVNIMHFKRWADRRKYTKARKTMQYPTLPQGTKLITIPPGHDNGGKANKRDWVMNMNDRSYLSVFHEYVGRALQKQPIYHFRQLENAAQPYQAIVYIGGMQYGVGYGSSKRQAKSAAARASIHILIPEMKDELDAAHPADRPSDKPQPELHDFFDLVGIEDPRITEFCAATCEPSPHAILRTCLLRNFGAGDNHIHTEMKKLEFQKIELTMKVGKHTATVVCKNKKTAKQRASQAILQALHPHVHSWGSLLRLYGSKSVKSCKEKKLEEQQITLLQDKARHNEPNYAVLEKLRHEMKKLRERDEAVVPIGTLLVKEDLPTHSGSNLNNVEL